MIGNQFKETLIDDVRFVINRLSENEKAIDDMKQALLDCATSIESYNSRHPFNKILEQEASHARDVLAKLESYRRGI